MRRLAVSLALTLLVTVLIAPTSAQVFWPGAGATVGWGGPATAAAQGAGGGQQSLSRDGSLPQRPPHRPDNGPTSSDRIPRPPRPSNAVGGRPAGGILATTAYAHDVYPDMTFNYIPNLATPGTWSTIVGGEPSFFAAGDFINGDLSTQYVLNYNTNEFMRVDTATGARTFINYAYPIGYEYWAGMTGAGGTLYVSSSECGWSSSLYTIDPTSGALTWIGTDYNVLCLIDIAYNPADGMIYGVDIYYDELVRINPATGIGTVVGYTGINANYAQSLDLDEVNGILYWAAFNYDTWQGELRTINMSTGMSALVGAFPGGAEVDAFSIATSTPPAPDLSASSKQATPKVEEGGIIRYTITLVNSGQVPATGVMMTDPVPASVYRGDLACSGGSGGTWGYDAINQRVWWSGNVGTRDDQNLLSDPGFENGPPPASAWTEWIDPVIIGMGCTEWIVNPTAVWGIPAHSGVYTFWTGGYCCSSYCEPNSDYVEQSVAIPAGCNGRLSYFANYYRPDDDDPPDADWFYVEASTDGGGSWTRFYQKEYLQANDSYPYWVEEGPFDLSAYNGRTTLLRIGGVSGPGSYTGNALVDDVLLHCGPARVDRVTCTFSASTSAPCGSTVTNQATISAPGMADVVVTATTQVVGKLYYFSDFEANNGGFSTTPPEWEWGVSNVEVVRAHSGDKVWGVDLDANYEDNGNYSLVRTVDTSSVPPMAGCVNPSLWLQWWEWYSTEPGFDYVNVYVNGAPLYSASGSSGGWVHRQYDISAYRGGPVNIEFRFTSDGSIRDYLGWYIDDVAVHLDCYGVDQDQAVVAPGACHLQPHNIWLGSTVDDEVFPGGDPPPEDDAIVPDLSVPWLPGNTVGVTVTVNGGSGFVKVWFDWNRNGVFEVGEDSVDPAASPGDNYYTLVVPPGFDPAVGPLPSRCRIYPSDPGAGASPGGLATGGEVEDVDLVVAPAAVRLVRFGVVAAGPGALVTWETASEHNNLGFHLYRSTSLEALGEPLNQGLIPSKSPGGGLGASYAFLDTTAQAGLTYYYTLEDVDDSGVRTPHGPVTFTLWRVYLPLIGR